MYSNNEKRTTARIYLPAEWSSLFALQMKTQATAQEQARRDAWGKTELSHSAICNLCIFSVADGPHLCYSPLV